MVRVGMSDEDMRDLVGGDAGGYESCLESGGAGEAGSFLGVPALPLGVRVIEAGVIEAGVYDDGGGSETDVDDVEAERNEA